MIYSYGLLVGLQSLLRGHISREALKNVVVPVNYWRTLEYRLVFDELLPQRSDVILDIGSPKLFSLYVAERFGTEICATDIEEYFIPDYGYFGAMRGIPPERYRLLRADGRKLQFADGAFNKVYSISVLEHIPGEGDSECMKEIARVLRPGGLCLLTVPFAPQSREEFRRAKDFYWSSKSGDVREDGDVFFQRRYSELDLQKRLIEPSGLSVRRIGYFGERLALREGAEIAHYLPPVTGPVHPLASKLFHVGPCDSWRGIPNPLGALVALEKR
jgi:SAM-dependent methyltransferase